MRDSGDLAHMSHPDSDLEAYDAQRREKRRRTCLSDAAEQRADILLCDRCKSEIRMYDRRESDRRGSDRRGSERRGGERRSSQRLAPERRGSERHEDSRRYRERRSDTYKDHDVDQDDHQGHSRRDLENRGRPRRDNGHHDSHDDDHDDDHGDDHLRDHHRPQNDPKNGQPQEYHRQEWKRRDGKRRDSDNRDAEFRSNERRDDENGDAASLRDPDRRDAEIHPGKSTVGESRDSAPASRKGRDEDVRGGKVREDAPESNARHEIQGRDVHYQNGERVNRELVKSDWKSLGDMHSPLRDRSPGRDRSLTRSAVFPFRRGQERSRGAGLRRPAAQEREDEYDRRPWDNNSSTPKNIGQRDANDDFPSRIDYASKSAHPDSDILRRNPRSPLSQDRPQSLKEASLTNRLPSVLRNADHNRSPVVGNLPNDRNNESRKDKPAKTSGRPSSQILQHLRSKVMASLSKTS